MPRSGHICETRNFYPRSPCGERPSSTVIVILRKNFYPRSPCGERHRIHRQFPHQTQISIHALLAESDGGSGVGSWPRVMISIHALLAESDSRTKTVAAEVGDFYPRSPCGERHIVGGARNNAIHFYPRSPCGERHATQRTYLRDEKFLSTLSLRRAT